jgi:hypothetical protein
MDAHLLIRPALPFPTALDAKRLAMPKFLDVRRGGSKACLGRRFEHVYHGLGLDRRNAGQRDLQRYLQRHGTGDTSHTPTSGSVEKCGDDMLAAWKKKGPVLESGSD